MLKSCFNTLTLANKRTVATHTKNLPLKYKHYPHRTPISRPPITNPDPIQSLAIVPDMPRQATPPTEISLPATPSRQPRLFHSSIDRLPRSSHRPLKWMGDGISPRLFVRCGTACPWGSAGCGISAALTTRCGIGGNTGGWNWPRSVKERLGDGRMMLRTGNEELGLVGNGS